jgi:hypothetical protein
MMRMNRQWMNADRRSLEYIPSMHGFLEVAKANKNPKGFMCSSLSSLFRQDSGEFMKSVFFLSPARPRNFEGL